MPTPFSLGLLAHLPQYKPLNGPHPLPMAYCAEQTEAVKTVLASPEVGQGVVAAQAAAKNLFQRLGQALAQQEGVTKDDLQQFTASRFVEAQAQVPETADLIYHHTAPLTFGERPWALHTECVKTLFFPFIKDYPDDGLAIRGIPIFHCVRTLLAEPACRVIFTNLKETAAQLAQVFDHPAISAKIRHLPVAMDPDAPSWERVQAKIDQRAQAGPNDPFHLLFTSSWNKNEVTFLNRGGHHVLSSFLTLAPMRPNLKLTIVSPTARWVAADLMEQARACPQITWIEDRVSEEDFFDLLLDADLFLNVGVALGSLSVVRAMAFGAPPLTSDAPGYEEYVKDGETGIMLDGVRKSFFANDPVSGYQWERWTDRHLLNPPYEAKLSQHFLRLSTNRQAWAALASQALEHVYQAHDHAEQSKAFRALMRAAWEGSSSL